MVIVRSKNSWWFKHINVKNQFCKYEIEKKILRSALRSGLYKLDYRLYFTKCFYKYTRNSSLSRYRTSCGFSRFGRVIFRRFGLSRHLSKRFCSDGFIMGMRKSSF